MSISLLLAAIMAGALKLFQSVQQFYQTMGMYSSQSSQLLSPNVRKAFFLISITAITVSIGWFAVFEASTIQEYGMSFYGVFSDLYALLDLIITTWQMTNILKLIELFEIFIEKSKSLEVNF